MRIKLGYIWDFTKKTLSRIGLRKNGIVIKIPLKSTIKSKSEKKVKRNESSI